MYSSSWAFKPVPYEQVLKADAEMQRVLSQAPRWMVDDSISIDQNWSSWIQWQRYSFMVGHRP